MARDLDNSYCSLMGWADTAVRLAAKRRENAAQSLP